MQSSPLARVFNYLVKLGIALGKKIVGNLHLKEVSRYLVAGGVRLVGDVVVSIAEVTVEGGKSVGNGIITGNFFACSSFFFGKCCFDTASRLAVTLVEYSVVGNRLARNVVGTGDKSLRSAVDIHKKQAGFAGSCRIFPCVPDSRMILAELVPQRCIAEHFADRIA